MKKRLLSVTLVLVFVLAFVPMTAAQTENTVSLTYIEIAPIEYHEMMYLFEGVYGFRVGSLWGTIGIDGQVIMPPSYDTIRRHIENNWAEVRVNNRRGFLDSSGREIIPTRYEATEEWGRDTIHVRLNGKWGIYDTTGKLIVPIIYDQRIGPFVDGTRIVERDGKSILIDLTGREIVQGHFYPSEGLILVYVDNLFGYMNLDGEIVIPPTYRNAEGFSEGLAAVTLDHNRWGFIDKTGVMVIPPAYQRVWPFTEGLAVVFDGNNHLIINKAGAVVSNLPIPEGHEFQSLRNGVAIVRIFENDDDWIGKHGAVDMKGNIVIPVRYSELFGRDGILSGMNPGDDDTPWSDYLFTGRDDVPIIRYDSIFSFTGVRSYHGYSVRTGFIDDVAEAYLDGKSGIVDRTGRELVPIGKYSIGRLFDGMASFLHDGKWGFIDLTGREVIAPIYDEVSYFADDLAIVARDDKYIIIDKTGRELLILPYDEVRRLEGDVFTVRRDRRWGAIRLVPLPPEAPNLSAASSWARPEIQSAFSKGFIPAELLGNYQTPIRRGEFVRLAMSYLRYKTGMTNDQLVAAYATHPNRIFTDVPNDSCLQAAGKLGITSGTGGTEPNRIFGDGLFDREMAAFMLRRVHIIVNGGSETVPDQGYSDMNEARWHQGAVNYVIHHNIMQGTDTARGIFSPRRNFTRQESIATFDRMG